jgi:hypothetical protein
MLFHSQGLIIATPRPPKSFTLHVFARDNREIVFQGSSGNHAIRRVEGRPFQLTLSLQNAPMIGDRVRDRQDAVLKPDQ